MLRSLSVHGTPDAEIVIDRILEWHFLGELLTLANEAMDAESYCHEAGDCDFEQLIELTISKR